MDVTVNEEDKFSIYKENDPLFPQQEEKQDNTIDIRLWRA